MGTYPSTLVYNMRTYETQCTNAQREMWVEREVGERGTEVSELRLDVHGT